MNRFAWASYGMYAVGGMVIVMFGTVLPLLLSHYNASYTMGGFLILLQFIGFIVGVPITVQLMHRLHFKTVLTLSALAVTLATGFITLLPGWNGLCVLAVLTGIGASSMETAVASYVMEMFVGQRAVVMGRLEIAFGLGALGYPFISLFYQSHHAWSFGFFTISLLALGLAAVWRFGSFDSFTPPAQTSRDAQTLTPPRFPNRRVKGIVLAMFLFMIFVYVGLEGSLNSFLPSIFVKALHAPMGLSTLSVSAFWIAMVVGRVAIGWVAQHLSYERYLSWSIVLTLLCLVLMAVFRSVGLTFALVLGVGLSMSAIYSVTMVYANHTFPKMERFVTSSVTAFAGLGGATFPFISGFGMDRLHASSILWLPVLYTSILALAFLCVLMSLHRLRRDG